MDSNFNRVWERVRAARSERLMQPERPYTGKAAPLNMKSALEGFIENEVSDSGYYSALASKTTQLKARRLFMRLSAEEKNHARQLQTAYFLLSGNSYAVKRPAKTPPRSMLEALRQRYSAENEGAAAYLSAAERTDNSELKQFFSELARDEKRHAAEIKRLVESSMG